MPGGAKEKSQGPQESAGSNVLYPIVKKSQTPPKQVKMHIGEALLLCLAETFSPENQPPLFNSGGIQPNLIFHYEYCILSASRRHLGHLPQLYVETFTSFWCVRSHLKHGVETKPYFPPLRFTAIFPPLGGQEILPSEERIELWASHSLSCPQEAWCSPSVSPTTCSCKSKARCDRSQLLWVPNRSALPPRQNAAAAFAHFCGKTSMHATCQVILVFLAFIGRALPSVCSECCVNACKKGKELWCSETNTLFIQIKKNATGICAATERCLQASGESITTRLSGFAWALQKEVEINFGALKDVSHPLHSQCQWE